MTKKSVIGVIDKDRIADQFFFLFHCKLYNSLVLNSVSHVFGSDEQKGKELW